MKYSIILIAAIAISLSSCGNSKKEAHAQDHADSDCTEHTHEVPSDKSVTQEEFVVASSDSTKTYSDEQCAGCSSTCSNSNKADMDQSHDHSEDHDKIVGHDHEHDLSGEHSHN